MCARAQAVGEFGVIIDKYQNLGAIKQADKQELNDFLKEAAERVRFGKALCADSLLHYGLSQGGDKGCEIIRSVLSQVAGEQVSEELLSPALLHAARQLLG
ncbi:unnamed protein product [Symbiodinium sp. CCMP2456]|nr:unnamed protein product [Symbiodinium sp. CCMP2456]